MSNAVLPSLAGFKFPVKKTPLWKGKVQEALSGHETRLGYWSSPRWRYTIGYEVLRNDAGYTELQQLVGFYNARYGNIDDWLYLDPDDNAVTSQLFGTGNGTQTQFGLVRTYGGFDEPVTAVNALTSIVRTDWQGTVTLTTASRTNYARQSQSIGTSPWTGNGGSESVASNTVVAPDGTTTADVINCPGAFDGYGQTAVASAAPFTSYVASCWLKGTPGATFAIYVNIGGATTAPVITLTGSWVRYSVTLTTGASPGSTLQMILTRNGNSATSVHAWGAQLEVGTTPSGYIPTTTSALTVADYTLSSAGVVTLGVPLATSGTLIWSGTYYWRVRWDDMEFELDKMMKGLWSSADLSFTTVK
jgi:hypothetical protein